MLTPAGRGAVATIHVAGPAALAIVQDLFWRASTRSLNDEPIGRICVGRWGGDQGEELVVCRRSAEEVEIHSHGGAAAPAAILADLAERGCQIVDAWSWVASQVSDPIQLAAQQQLAKASTERTAAILLDQYHGALRGAIDQLQTLATMLGDQSDAASEQAQKFFALLDSLLQHADLGLQLTTPWRVVLCGEPNVGKSSLINALLGYQRSIVFDAPGTTRDVLTAAAAFDGWPAELIDTAGLRQSDHPLEAAGVELAQAAIATADLILEIREATEATAKRPTPSPLKQTAKSLIVFNKVDLIQANRVDVGSMSSMWVSARTGEALPKLQTAIANRLVPSPPQPGAPVPFTTDQVEALRQAHKQAQRNDWPAASKTLANFTAFHSQPAIPSPYPGRGLG